jgi:hypothetical protein
MRGIAAAAAARRRRRFVFEDSTIGFDSGGTIAQGTLFRLVVLSALPVLFQVEEPVADLAYDARQLNTTKLFSLLLNVVVFLLAFLWAWEPGRSAAGDGLDT